MRHIHKWQTMIRQSQSAGSIEIEHCYAGALCLAVRVTQEHDYQLEEPANKYFKPRKRQVKIIPCMTKPKFLREEEI